ncbi:phosphoadenylyl-sulfate reductase [Solirhodobacter olei]|uniref:phosphoadenylyl-sulfate reductase n=1 Tax=Solirhodobacter olei TaxID=2493082 RepID=UPI000FDBDA14|nr:phosphoadenylyl-sulfate reductase [Solirhodobacter olei]
MPLEAPLPSAAERVAELNARTRHHSAPDVLAHALRDPLVGRIAMVSSFGAESVVLLHLVAQVDRTVPVVFVDTRMLFEETLAYQAEVAEQLGLAEIRIIRPDPVAVLARDVDNILHQTDPDACCALRKTEPLERALGGFDAWINGRKRYQGQSRTEIDFFETDDAGRIKVNPLAMWDRDDLQSYIVENRLPRHPLVAKGFPSIGCAPCTTPVKPGEDPRAGRWRGRDKEECGIHFVGGRLVRGGSSGTGSEESAA